jgi:O-antigen/teichoic acid export membrane protein
LKLINILKKIKLYYLINVLSSALFQLIALALVYVFTPDEYGQFALITTVAQLMFLITSGWNASIILNLGSRQFAQTGGYKNMVLYRTILSIPLFILVTVFFLCGKESILFFIGNPNYYNLVYFFFLGLVFFDFSNHLLFPANRNLLQTSLTFILSLSLFLYVALRNVTLEEYIHTNYYANTLYLLLVLIFYFFLFQKEKIVWKCMEFKDVFLFALWQVLSVISIYIINIGTNYVLRIFDVSVDEIGLYNFSYKLFLGFAPIFSLYNIVLPKIIHNKNALIDYKRLFKSIKVGVLIFSGCFIFLWLFLKPFLFLISKVDYIQSVDYFILLFPAFIFIAFNNLIIPVIINTSYYKYSSYAILIQAASMLVFCPMGVYICGVYGAIISTTISALFASSFLYVMFKSKILKIQ